MRMLVYPELKPRKGIRYSNVHLRRLEAVGDFPRRVRLGGNCVAWVESEIDAWLEARAAERKIVAAEAESRQAEEADAENGDESEDEAA